MSRKTEMSRTGVLLLGMTLLGLSLLTQPTLAQTTPAQTTPAPAFGQEPTPPPPTPAPPVPSLDEPSVEPGIAVRSYLQPGIHLTETVNSNLGSGTGGGGGVVGITRALGSLDLRRLWSHYDMSVKYIGGAALFSDNFGSPSQTHSLDASQRYSWRTGQIQLCDGLSYLQEGSFGFSGGSVGGNCGGGSGPLFGFRPPYFVGSPSYNRNAETATQCSPAGA